MSTSFQPTHRKSGRPPRYTASLFGLQGTPAPSKAQASAALYELLYHLTARMSAGLRIRFAHGITIVVFPSLEGWAYTLVGGAQTTMTVSMGPESSPERVEYAAYHHAAQMAWSSECNDDWGFVRALPPLVVAGASLHTDLLDWIAWQRDYEHLLRGGLSAHDSHQRASNLRKDRLLGLAVRANTAYHIHMWTDFDHPPGPREHAACGLLVNRDRLAPTHRAPTCPRCLQLYAQHEYGEV